MGDWQTGRVSLTLPRDYGIPICAACMRDPDGNKLCAPFITGEGSEVAT
jgi:hypothetical protein